MIENTEIKEDTMSGKNSKYKQIIASIYSVLNLF